MQGTQNIGSPVSREAANNYSMRSQQSAEDHFAVLSSTQPAENVETDLPYSQNIANGFASFPPRLGPVSESDITPESPQDPALAAAPTQIPHPLLNIPLADLRYTSSPRPVKKFSLAPLHSPSLSKPRDPFKKPQSLKNRFITGALERRAAPQGGSYVSARKLTGGSGPTAGKKRLLETYEYDGFEPEYYKIQTTTKKRHVASPTHSLGSCRRSEPSIRDFRDYEPKRPRLSGPANTPQQSHALAGLLPYEDPGVDQSPEAQRTPRSFNSGWLPQFPINAEMWRTRRKWSKEEINRVHPGDVFFVVCPEQAMDPLAKEKLHGMFPSDFGPMCIKRRPAVAMRVDSFSQTMECIVGYSHSESGLAKYKGPHLERAKKIYWSLQDANNQFRHDSDHDALRVLHCTKELKETSYLYSLKTHPIPFTELLTPCGQLVGDDFLRLKRFRAEQFENENVHREHIRGSQLEARQYTERYSIPSYGYLRSMRSAPSIRAIAAAPKVALTLSHRGDTSMRDASMRSGDGSRRGSGGFLYPRAPPTQEAYPTESGSRRAPSDAHSRHRPSMRESDRDDRDSHSHPPDTFRRPSTSSSDDRWRR
ncbi:hypothetical protein K458DRAFT_410955 [Lentithecium fluviatile CBS 122367]|uniref:Uncharacterized protein n=1 Tax=Lentithecium fluviatile CBS 122367 TaxID=1168545 RepID=A0A6G1ICQ9_9PLEO|nr:hypothetical protein K458DRAFT_410955 [Lentithecium fluviatile CBS 122367]